MTTFETMQLELEIRSCVMYFGPITLSTLKDKLDMRYSCVSYEHIEQCADSLVERKRLKYADGFGEKAYKL
jgi:hypothetical protein